MITKVESKNLLDPRSKLAVFIAACFSAFSGLSLAQEMGLLFLCVVTAILCSKCKGAFYIAVSFALMYLCDLYLVPRVSGVLNNLIMLFCHLLRFMLPLFAAFYLAVKTTKIGEFISAFMHMHMPGEVIIPLAVMFRFVPTVQEEWIAVNQALTLRGMAFTWTNVLRKPLQMMEYMLVPFLLQCSVIVDEMSAAVMARGFERDNPRSSYVEVRMKWKDWCIVCVALVLLLWNLI